MYKLWQLAGDGLFALSELLSYFAMYCYGELDHPIAQWKLGKKLRELDGQLRAFEEASKSK